MRYQEAYEQVQLALQKAELSFAISENILNTYFDIAVEDIGLRVLRKRDIERFTSLASKELVFTKSNISNQIYKVQFDEKVIPFVDRALVNEGKTNTDYDKLGYYIDTNVSTGSIIEVQSDNPIQIVSVSHGLDSNDYVIISEIVGLLSDNGAKSEVNGIRHKITQLDANRFTIPIDVSSYEVAYSSGGKWQEDTKKLFWSKTPASGKTVEVHYFAKPEKRSGLASRIDLPESLLKAVIHEVIGTLLDLDGNFQIASGHHGLARKIEREYFVTSRTNQAMPDLIPLPLPDFV